MCHGSLSGSISCSVRSAHAPDLHQSRVRRAVELCPGLTPAPKRRVLCSLWGFGNWSLSRAGKATDPNVLICVQGKEVFRGEKREGNSGNTELKNEGFKA